MPEWDEVAKAFNLGFPFAWLYVEKCGTLNRKGWEQVLATYDFLLLAFDIPEEQYRDVFDMIGAKK